MHWKKWVADKLYVRHVLLWLDVVARNHDVQVVDVVLEPDCRWARQWHSKQFRNLKTVLGLRGGRGGVWTGWVVVASVED